MMSDDDREELARAIMDGDEFAHVERLLDEARADERERIAQRVEGSIEAHRNAGSHVGVSVLAPLPNLIRRSQP